MKKLSQILLSMIPVVLGVLLGLMINSWRESAKNAKYLERTFQSIEAEIHEGHESVTEVQEIHQALIDSLEFYFEDESMSVMDIIGTVGGVKYPIVPNIGLRFFVGSRADLIDYEIISLLSNIEDTKHILEKKFDILLNYASEHLDGSKTDTKSKQVFGMHLANLIDSEEQLTRLFEIYLEEYSSQATIQSK